MTEKQVTSATIKDMKKRGEPITMITAYDFAMARNANEAGIDMILVGDSVGNVMLGYNSTVPVTMDEMIHHTKAVMRLKLLSLRSRKRVGGKEKTEQNLMKLSYTIKQTKLHILKILESKKRKGQRTYLKKQS